MTRVCQKCGKEKPIGEFMRTPHIASGRYHKCRSCMDEDAASFAEKTGKRKRWVERELKKRRCS